MLMLGASDGIQTRGLFLGKEALYQLSYTRMFFINWELYSIKHRYRNPAPLRNFPFSFKIPEIGALAQLVEQRLEEPCVLGSSPRGATSVILLIILQANSIDGSDTGE